MKWVFFKILWLIYWLTAYNENLFSGRSIACVMGALEISILRILFAGWPTSCGMGVSKVFLWLIYWLTI